MPAWVPVLKLAVVMLALTGGDWAILAAAIVGSSGLGGTITALVGMRKLKVDEKQVTASVETQARTVAAEEAEAAMRVMGAALAVVKAELLDQQHQRKADRESAAATIAQIKEQLDACLASCEDCRKQLREVRGQRE